MRGLGLRAAARPGSTLAASTRNQSSGHHPARLPPPAPVNTCPAQNIPQQSLYSSRLVPTAPAETLYHKIHHSLSLFISLSQDTPLFIALYLFITRYTTLYHSLSLYHKIHQCAQGLAELESPKYVPIDSKRLVVSIPVSCLAGAVLGAAWHHCCNADLAMDVCSRALVAATPPDGAMRCIGAVGRHVGRGARVPSHG